MKYFAILSVLILLLGGNLRHGGVFSSSAWAAEGGEGGEKEKADPNAPHPEFDYIQLDPLTLPVITNKGLTQQVSLKVQLEVDWGKKDEIEGFEPRLIDAYLQDLYGALGAGRALMNDNVVDIVKVKQRLTAVTDKVLGPDHKVHEVLLQVLQQRPM